MIIWSGYPNYGSKNKKGGNLKRKGERKWKWKENENNIESPAFSLNTRVEITWFIVMIMFNFS